MGTPKLMLLWRGRPVVAHALDCCTNSGASRTVVVVRSDNAALVDECRRWNVDLVLNDCPNADMKSSVQVALRWIAATYAPSNADAWLLVPADAVGISSDVIDQLLTKFDPDAPKIVAPVADGRPGHPLLLPWPLAAQVHQLGPAEGIDALLTRFPYRELAVMGDAIHRDLDTPAEYERLVDEER
jgi:molybdenum cofactor cytidylyltransferase